MQTKSPLNKKTATQTAIAALGPGIITGAADDDPSGIGTYTQAGAMFGTGLLWTALITWPLMATVQMACARIGMVSGAGLNSALAQKFPRPLLLSLTAALFFANTLNVGADLAAMADSAELLTGVSSHALVVAFGAAIGVATVRFNYATLARIMKWLALSLFAYVIAAFIAKPNWFEALSRTFLPQFPSSAGEWSMLVAILGTTISPYLFYWQASQEVEEEISWGRDTLAKRKGASSREILNRKIDVGLGTFFSNLVMYFIILASAVTLHRHGLVTISTSKEAAIALVPLAGRFAAFLYCAGLIGVGVLAIPTLTGSAAYALADLFKWRQGMDYRFDQARAFYSVIGVSMAIAIAIDFSNFNPMRALYLSAVVNGLLAPFILVGVFLIVRDKKIMNGQTSSRTTQAVLGACILLMFGASIAMFVV